MNRPTTKSDLTEPQSRLVALLQQLSFCRIEGLHVRQGDPAFDPAPRIIHRLKMGGENGPRPETDLTDFILKQQVRDLLMTISTLGDGEILSIEVKHGLPLVVEIERDCTPGGRLEHD